MKFCDECGQSIQTAPEATPVDYEQPKSYTPKFLAEKILTTRSSIEGERKLVTVFFADVANYTMILQQNNGVGVKPLFCYSNIPTHNSRAIYNH